ncbi:methyltransferase family protein [Priestia endophytica]|uniref:methyltransferase family protein n=1 Tax=Priestia endophytica TaxID=135735 RepID=UPI003D2CCDE2
MRKSKIINFLIPSFFGLCIPYLFYILIPINMPINRFIWFFLINSAGLGFMIFGILNVIVSARIIYGHLDTPLWDKPPKKLAVYGPYKYCRNPMTLGFLAILLGEGLFFKSIGILIWTVIFLIISTFLIIKIEEPSLRQKFGKEYDDYFHRTPRWISFNYSYHKQNNYRRNL